MQRMANKRPHNTAAAKRQQQRREELRERLKGIEYLRQWDECGIQLKEIRADLKKNIRRYGPDEVANIRAQIAAIQARIDLNSRRIAKILPDFKAVEFTDSQGENPFETFAAAVARALGDDPI